MLVLALSRAGRTINSTQQNYSLFLTLMSIDFVSNLIVNSSLWNLIQIKSAVVRTLDIIETDLNSTELDSVILYSLTTEDQVRLYTLRGIILTVAFNSTGYKFLAQNCSNPTTLCYCSR